MYLMRPMLATRGTAVPTGPEWLHEVKWDGIRVLAEVGGGRLRLWSRNGNDVSAAYPELAPLAEATGGHDVLLDGEVVAFDDGVPSFGALADRMHVRNARKAASLATTNPVTLMVFDLLSVDGVNRDDLYIRNADGSYTAPAGPPPAKTIHIDPMW